MATLIHKYSLKESAAVISVDKLRVYGSRYGQGVNYIVFGAGKLPDGVSVVSAKTQAEIPMDRLSKEVLLTRYFTDASGTWYAVFETQK